MNLLEAMRGHKTADSDPVYSAPASDRRRAQAVVDGWFAELKRERGGILTVKAKITPALAELILQRNSGNRKIVPSALQQRKADFAEGRFVFNGETIKISAKGKLLDGQHRLTACVETGVTFESLIVVGLPEDAGDTVDQGARRLPGQQLYRMGHVDGNNLATAARIYWQMERFGRVSSNPEMRPTWPQVQDVVEKHSELAALSLGHKAKRAHLCGAGLLTALHLWFARIDKDAADKFFQALVSGANLRESSPIFRLRKTLTEGTRPWSEIERAAFIIKAWNAVRTGRRLQALRLLGTEDFPKAI